MIDKKKNTVGIIIAILLGITIIIEILLLWQFSTSRASGKISCESKEITYISYKEDVSCIGAVRGEGFTVCALPKDLKCEGIIQDFPIMRFLIEATS